MATNKQIHKIQKDQRFSWDLKVSTGADGKQPEKYVVWGGAYYTITGSVETSWECYPAGGGFQTTVPKDSGELASCLPSLHVECLAYFEDGKRYPCTANPLERWNGWAVPHFSLGVVLEIAKDSGLLVIDQSDDSILIGRVGEGATEEGATEVNRRSDGLWSFSGWCWDLDETERR